MTTFEGQHFTKNTTPLFTMFPSVQVSGSGIKNVPRSQMGFSYTAHQQTSSSGGAGDADSFWSQTKQVRHVQHTTSSATQWSEIRNHSVTPGVVMTTRTASVSQWTEISSGGQKTEVTHETSQSQFQSFISPPSTTSSSTGPILALTDKEYLDNLQLPTEPLDLAAQLGKSCIGRKGSLGGRRPPTIRTRRSSQGSLSVQENESVHSGLANGAEVANGRLVSSSQIESSKTSGSRSSDGDQSSVPRLGTSSLLTGLTASTTSSATSTAIPVLQYTVAPAVVSTKSTATKTPPPRPPPPVFRSERSAPAAAPAPAISESRVLLELQLADAQLRANNELKQLLLTTETAENKSVASLRDWSTRSASSISSTPPSLPATSPPPLPGPDDGVMDFILQSSTPKTVSPDFTDVVDIHDKESVEDGQIVRRRTIITLGPKVNSGVLASGVSGSQPSSFFSSGAEFAKEGDFPRSSELKVSSGSINVTLKNTQSDCGPKKEGVSTMFVRASDSDKRVSRVSAFNVRRTIEQRRNAAQQHQPSPSRASRASAEDISSVANGSTSSINNKSRTRTPSPVSSTYLYGADGDALSAASSSDLSVARTMSISMSFDDLDSNSEAGGSHGPARIKKNEAWYERRQSYGFEAADKLQSLLNTSNGSSETRDLSSSSTRVSRSCDSLGSTVKSTSSNIEKMIPPWIKMSPSSAGINDDYLSCDRESRANENRSRASSRFSYLFGENPSTDNLAATQPQDKIPSAASGAPAVLTPTPVATAAPAAPSGPVRRSESAKEKEKTRSATNLLDQKAKESEPVWLRDLKIRRSLREQRSPRFTPREEEPKKSADPPWINVKLRPTGVKLIDDHVDQPKTTSPAPPVFHRLATSSSRDSLLNAAASGAESTQQQSRIPRLFLSRSSTFSSRDSLTNNAPPADTSSEVKPKRAEPKLFQRASWNSRDSLQFAGSSQVNELKTQRLFQRASRNNSRDSLHSTGADAKEADASKKTSARSSRESLTSLVGPADSPRVPPLNLAGESKAQKLINKSLNSRESLLSAGSEAVNAVTKNTQIYRATVETSSQSKVDKLVNKSSFNSRESLDKIVSEAAPVQVATGQRPSQPVEDKPVPLLHTKSIELMRMLDDTRLLSQSVAKSATQQQDGRHSEGAADVAAVQADPAPAVTPAPTVSTTLFISEIRASDSLNDVTECQSNASVKNSMEDLTQAGKRTKKVVFDKDTKEESDRMSRPRRIRSRSPETRLRQWQTKLETRVMETSPESMANASGLPLTRFGDLESEIPVSTGTGAAGEPDTRTETASETFRSLLLPRKSFAFTESSEFSSSSENYSKRFSLADEHETPLEEIVSAGVTTIPVRAPTIVNGIVNFDYSVERKIVILETEKGPAPKSILKKRSLENLLDDRASVKEETASVSAGPTIVNANPSSAPAPTVMKTSVTLCDDFTLPAGGGIIINGKPSSARPSGPPELSAPWKVNLKRVDPPLKGKTSDDELSEERPAPWRAEFIRKRATVPSGGIRETSRSSTSEKDLDQRPEEPHLTPPAAEEPVKKISDPVVSRIPVVMVARCELKHSHSLRQTTVGVSSGSSSLVTSLQPAPEEQAKCDLGYHSLETDPALTNRGENNNNKVNNANQINNNDSSGSDDSSSSSSSSRGESSETIHKTIDEVIEKLNETIEEMRSVDQVIRSSDPLAEEAPVVQASSPPPQSPPPPSTLPSHVNPLEIAQTSASQSDGSRPLDEDPPQAPRKMSVAREDKKVPDAKPISEKSDAPPPVPPPPKIETDLPIQVPPAKDSGYTSTVSITKIDSDINQRRTVTSSLQTQVQRHSFSSVTGIRVAIPVRPVSPTLSEQEATVEDILRKFEGLRTKSTKVESKWDAPAPAPLAPSRFSSRNTVAKSTALSSVSVQRSSEGQTRTTKVVAKEEKNIQLTSGMAEEKAALLVRKFFNNSVIDTRKARIAKTDTIPEETSGTEPSSPSTPSPVITNDRSKASADERGFFPSDKDEPLDLPSETGTSDVSFDAEDLFRPSSSGELNDFGSALDLLDSILDTMTDDDSQSFRTESSKTLTTSRRDSTSDSVTDSDISTSDTSFKFSDFVRGSSASQSASSFNHIDSSSSPPSSPPPSPPPPRDSVPENLNIVPPKRTKGRPGLKMALTPTSSSASGSVRSVPKPTQISSHLRVKAVITAQASCIDRPTKTSAMKDVRNTAAQSEGNLIHKSPTAAAKVSTRTEGKISGSSRERTSSGASPAVRKATHHKPSKSAPSDDATAVADASKLATKSPLVGSSRAAKSSRSIRAAHSNSTAESKGLMHSSSRTPTKNSRSRTSSAKEDVNNKKPSKSASPKTTSHERRTSSSALLKTNRLVTITPYSSKGTAPDEAVTGIRETPIVVSSGHYKIRTEQRIPSTNPIKASASGSSLTKTFSSHRTTVTTTTEKRLALTKK